MISGNRDFDQRTERRTAQVLRGFLKSYARLLEAGCRGADNVGESAHAVGDHQDRQGIPNRVERSENSSFLGHRQIPKREDDPRHRERKHGDRIEDFTPGKFCADDNVGDGDAQANIHQCGQAGVFETVLNGRKGEIVAQGVPEILERPAVGKNVTVPIA